MLAGGKYQWTFVIDKFEIQATTRYDEKFLNDSLANSSHPQSQFPASILLFLSMNRLETCLAFYLIFKAVERRIKI